MEAQVDILSLLTFVLYSSIRHYDVISSTLINNLRILLQQNKANKAKPRNYKLKVH